MATTLTATYATEAAARNAYDDLIGSGYPREKIFHQKDVPEIKVMSPRDTLREAREILARHEPSKVIERETRD
ncbi:MAG: hypothetical protein O2898_07625 [Proteobacteria bacterium]|nr:hypothetical protein [Pseudomonadota bacterium]